MNKQMINQAVIIVPLVFAILGFFANSTFVQAQEQFSESSQISSERQVMINNLLEQIGRLQKELLAIQKPSSSNVVIENDSKSTIEVLENIRVRSEAGLTGEILKTKQKGSQGKIVAGPIQKGDNVWYKIEYSDGTVGWSVANWLKFILDKVDKVDDDEAYNKSLWPKLISIKNDFSKDREALVVTYKFEVTAHIDQWVSSKPEVALELDILVPKGIRYTVSSLQVAGASKNSGGFYRIVKGSTRTIEFAIAFGNIQTNNTVTEYIKINPNVFKYSPNSDGSDEYGTTFTNDFNSVVALEATTKVCRADAYTCADGTVVGRTGSQCSFVCPVDVSVVVETEDPIMKSFTLSPKTVTTGQKVTFTWSSENTSSCMIHDDSSLLKSGLPTTGKYTYTVTNKYNDGADITFILDCNGIDESKAISVRSIVKYITPTICRADAYTCADGTVVERTGSQCSFVCPDVKYIGVPSSPLQNGVWLDVFNNLQKIKNSL